MANFASLLDVSLKETKEEKAKPKSQLNIIQSKPKAAKPKKGLGCDHCELNSKERRKFITKVRGRKIMIVGTHPSEEDVDDKKLLKSSTAARFLWREFAKIGVTRDDCDIQVALRCSPGYSTYIGNKKYKHPLRCCSEHTTKALEESKAKLYLIFGMEAASQLLGKEYRKGTHILWSEKLNAKVYVFRQLTSYIRAKVTPAEIKEFRNTVALIQADLKKKHLSKYQYIDEQDYQGITTGSEAKKEVKLIRKVIAEYRHTHNKPLRLYCDEEAAVIKKQWESLCVGTCIKPGRVRVFVVSPLLVKLKERKRVRRYLKELLEDPNIEKAFHHGSYDVPAIADHLDIHVTNFHFDTNYSSYLYNPEALKSWGLDVVGLHYFPQFGEYKTIILPEALPKDFDLKQHRLTNATPTQVHDYITARGLFNLSHLPLWKLVKYNGADCDLGKRLELKTAKKVSLPLLSVYTDVAFVLDAMVPNGPCFDYKQYKKLKAILPPRLEALHKKLKKWAKNDKFNPNAAKQVAALLYDKLKLKPLALTDKQRRDQKSERSTDKTTLEVLSRKHPVPKLISEYRRLKKMISTYLDSYSFCADNNNGKLRTKWWLTGTRTGRLSSGGDKNKKADITTKVVNLQNVHGDPNLQNMLVPDPKWRKLYEALKEAVASVLNEFERGKLKHLAKDPAKVKEYEAFAEGCYTKLSKSLKFRRACEKILRKYGDVRIVLGFDQGQVEVRVMAQASGDKNLIRDCMSGDIHSMVGHRMTGWPVEKIKHDKKTRTLTKNIHFGILFGLGAAGLMAFILNKDPDATITEAKAIELWEAYFRAYPGVRRFIERCRAFVEEHGYIDNMFGFVRPLGSNNYSETEDEDAGGSFWGNQAINTPIQGAAHQLMLMAMTRLKDMESKYRKILHVPGMEVHDAIYWWTKLKDLMKTIPVAKELLEKEPLKVVKKLYPEIDWKIPLVVEGKAGLRMGDTVEIEGMEIHQILAQMFLSSYRTETSLNHQLRKVA